jgi:hypothetical protein
VIVEDHLERKDSKTEPDKHTYVLTSSPPAIRSIEKYAQAINVLFGIESFERIMQASQTLFPRIVISPPSLGQVETLLASLNHPLIDDAILIFKRNLANMITKVDSSHDGKKLDTFYNLVIEGWNVAKEEARVMMCKARGIDRLPFQLNALLTRPLNFLRANDNATDIILHVRYCPVSYAVIETCLGHQNQVHEASGPTDHIALAMDDAILNELENLLRRGLKINMANGTTQTFKVSLDAAYTLERNPVSCNRLFRWIGCGKGYFELICGETDLDLVELAKMFAIQDASHNSQNGEHWKLPVLEKTSCWSWSGGLNIGLYMSANGQVWAYLNPTRHDDKNMQGFDCLRSLLQLTSKLCITRNLAEDTSLPDDMVELLTNALHKAFWKGGIGQIESSSKTSTSNIERLDESKIIQKARKRCVMNRNRVIGDRNEQNHYMRAPFFDNKLFCYMYLCFVHHIFHLYDPFLICKFP